MMIYIICYIRLLVVIAKMTVFFNILLLYVIFDRNGNCMAKATVIGRNDHSASFWTDRQNSVNFFRRVEDFF